MEYELESRRWGDGRPIDIRRAANGAVFEVRGQLENRT
jgi:hypothetical protein